MRKIWLLPILFLLAACQAGGGAPVEDRTDTEAVAESSETTSDPVTETDSEDTEVVDPPTDPLDNNITISDNPAEAGVVRERDWTKGAEDPLVTIIEYGDFQ